MKIHLSIASGGLTALLAGMMAIGSVAARADGMPGYEPGVAQYDGWITVTLSWCTNRCATFCAPSTGIQGKTSGHKRPKAERRTKQLVVTARLSSRRRTS